jgi:hypothetical protein
LGLPATAGNKKPRWLWLIESIMNHFKAQRKAIGEKILNKTCAHPHGFACSCLTAEIFFSTANRLRTGVWQKS